MIGKRSSLIKYPKDGVIHCKAMRRLANSSLCNILTLSFFPKDYIVANMKILLVDHLEW